MFQNLIYCQALKKGKHAVIINMNDIFCDDVETLYAYARLNQLRCLIIKRGNTKHIDGLGRLKILDIKISNAVKSVVFCCTKEIQSPNREKQLQDLHI